MTAPHADLHRSVGRKGSGRQGWIGPRDMHGYQARLTDMNQGGKHVNSTYSEATSRSISLTYDKATRAHEEYPERNEDYGLIDSANGLAIICDGVGCLTITRPSESRSRSARRFATNQGRCRARGRTSKPIFMHVVCDAIAVRASQESMPAGTSYTKEPSYPADSASAARAAWARASA